MIFVPRPKGLGKDAFLKLVDGEEVKGVFRGEPYRFLRHWSNQRSVECIGDGCPVCAVDKENRPSFRFRINFLTSRDGKWFAKIFEGGGDLYDSLTSLDRKFDLSSTVVDITRRGTKQNTRYEVIPMAHMRITDEMRAQIAAVELLPLSSITSAESEA